MKLGDKQKYGLFFVGFLLVLGVTLFISFTLTGNLIVDIPSGEESFFVNEDVDNLYNFTIENPEVTGDLNLTEVKITLPESFSFLENSNGTDTDESSFIQEDNILSWSEDGLVMNLSIKNFWFNATASTPGNYNLTITLTSSNGSQSFNLLTVVNDTTVPSSVEFASPSENDNSNLSKSSILVNFTANDNGVLDVLEIKLFNSTGEINFSSSSVSPLFVNFTGLLEGTYYFNATANDTFGNLNSTTTRTVNLDNTDPVVTLIEPEDSVSSSVDDYDFSFEVDDLGGISSCILIIDESEGDSLSSVDSEGETNELSSSSLSVLEHTWSVSCTDWAGNVGISSSRTLTVTNESSEVEVVAETPAAADISGDVVNGDLEISIEPETEEIASGGSSSTRYEKEFLENENFSLSVNEEIHIFSVRGISNESVNITLFSNPQDAVFLVEEEKKFDVSRDGYYELLIRLNSIEFNEEGFFKTNFTIEVINESISSLDEDNGAELTGNEFGEVGFSIGEMSSIGWFIAILIIFLLVFSIVKILKLKGSREEKKKSQKKGRIIKSKRNKK